MSTPRRQVIESNIENSLQREQEAQQAPAFQSGTGTGPLLNNFTAQALGQVQGYLTQGAQNIVSHKQEEQFISGAMDYLQGKTVEQLQEKSGKNLYANKGYMVLDVNNKFTSFMNEFKNKIDTDYYSQSPEEFKETSATLFGEQLKGLDPITANMFKEKLLPVLPQITEMQMIAHDNFNTGETIKVVGDTIRSIDKTNSKDDILQTMLDIGSTLRGLNPQQRNAALTNGLLETLSENDNLDAYNAISNSMHWKNLDVNQKNTLSNVYSEAVKRKISKFDKETTDMLEAINTEFFAYNSEMDDTAYADAIYGVFKEHSIRKEDLLPSYVNTKISQKNSEKEALEIAELTNAQIVDDNYDVARHSQATSNIINKENKVQYTDTFVKILTNKTKYKIDNPKVNNTSILIAATKFSAEEVNAWSEKGGQDGEIQEYVSKFYDRKLNKAVTQINEQTERVGNEIVEKKTTLSNTALEEYSNDIKDISFKVETGQMSIESMEEALIKARTTNPNLVVTKGMFTIGADIKDNRKRKVYLDNQREKLSDLENELAINQKKYSADMTKLFEGGPPGERRVPTEEEIDALEIKSQEEIDTLIRNSGLDPAVINSAIPKINLQNSISAAQVRRKQERAILTASKSYKKRFGDYPKDIEGKYLNPTILQKLFNESTQTQTKKRKAEEATRPTPIAPGPETATPKDIAGAILETGYVPGGYKKLGVKEILLNADKDGINPESVATIAGEFKMFYAVAKDSDYLAKQIGGPVDRVLLELIKDKVSDKYSIEDSIKYAASLGTTVNEVQYKEMITELDTFIIEELGLPDYNISGPQAEFITASLHMEAAKTLLTNKNNKMNISKDVVKKMVKNFFKDNVVEIKDGPHHSVLIHEDSNKSFMHNMFDGGYADMLDSKDVSKAIRKYLIAEGTDAQKTALTTPIKKGDTLLGWLSYTDAQGGIPTAVGDSVRRGGARGISVTYDSKTNSAAIRIKPAYQNSQDEAAYLASDGNIDLALVDIPTVGEWYIDNFREEIIRAAKRRTVIQDTQEKMFSLGPTGIISGMTLGLLDNNVTLPVDRVTKNK
jgi:hypothetical protein